MRKVSMPILLGSENRCLFRRRFHKIKIVSISFPVGNASEQATFSTTVGLYGLRIADFCLIVNTDTVDWFTRGIMINALLYIYGKICTIIYQAPATYTLAKILFRFYKGWYRLYHIRRLRYPRYIMYSYMISLLQAASNAPLQELFDTAMFTKQVMSKHRAFNLKKLRRISQFVDVHIRSSKNRRKKKIRIKR